MVLKGVLVENEWHEKSSRGQYRSGAGGEVSRILQNIGIIGEKKAGRVGIFVHYQGSKAALWC